MIQNDPVKIGILNSIYIYIYTYVYVKKNVIIYNDLENWHIKTRQNHIKSPTRWLELLQNVGEAGKALKFLPAAPVKRVLWRCLM